MNLNFVNLLLVVYVVKIAVADTNIRPEKPKIAESIVSKLTDEKWDQIQKGQWLVEFYDTETEKSFELEETWQIFAADCKKLNINVGQVLASENPGLSVRFVVSEFPKVFYIKNGVAHEIPKKHREKIMSSPIQDGAVELLSILKPVNFLSNPFSVQMSLLSYLFIHGANLYNYEHAIVQKIVPISSATDIFFILTFLIVGIFLGLLMTLAFGVLQIFLTGSKVSEDDDGKYSGDEDESEEETGSTEKSDSVRKRK